MDAYQKYCRRLTALGSSEYSSIDSLTKILYAHNDDGCPVARGLLRGLILTPGQDECTDPRRSFKSLAIRYVSGSLTQEDYTTVLASLKDVLESIPAVKEYSPTIHDSVDGISLIVRD